jgi:hypothetical protein
MIPAYPRTRAIQAHLPHRSLWRWQSELRPLKSRQIGERSSAIALKREVYPAGATYRADVTIVPTLEGGSSTRRVAPSSQLIPARLDHSPGSASIHDRPERTPFISVEAHHATLLSSPKQTTAVVPVEGHKPRGEFHIGR